MLAALRGYLLAGRRIGLSGGLALAVWAVDAQAIFIVNQPWVRPAAQGRSTEAYMDLTSTEGAALVGARSDLAAAVAIRAPGKGAGDVGRLRLPANAMIRLAPGGYRMVLSKLARPIKLGERVMLTLTIEAADGARQDIPVNAEVRLRSPLADERRAHGGAH
jgi:copper(I)-binding protein